MSKNKGKDKFNIMSLLAKGNPIAIVSEQLNGKGIIKGSKKEKRRYGAMCFHHKINKKGKQVPTIYTLDNGHKCCEMCNGEFDINTLEKKDVKEAVAELEMIINQAKYIAIATKCDDATIKYLASLHLHLAEFPEKYKNISEIAERVDKIKNGKNKDNNKKGNKSPWGSWGVQ